MTASSRPRRGFTLIEILMVVVILGVLATVIIGLFSNATGDAAGSALKDNLRGIRGALQVYYAQHGAYPAVSTFDAQMTQYSDVAGNTSTAMTSTYRFGPYMLQVPPLPVGANRGNATVTGTTYSSGFGWQYDSATGDFHANCPDSETDAQGNVYHLF